ncbi:MAG: phosphatidylglycerol lysyltransferase domain-containing protein [Bacteroides sp.]|nr:phosphatidylglycerol lysyltransferase domain-containing protein [Bacteroides sp.]
MIHFKDIEIQDKPIVTAYTLDSPRLNCDLSFSNLCSWRFLYNTQFAVLDDFLLLKFWAEGELVYMMPIGSGRLKKPVLDALIDDAHRERSPFCLLGICADMCSELEALMPGRFRFTADRDYADYVYLRSDLATLAGKKFQPKRNHVNKFKRTYPDYEYTPITPDRIGECLALEAEWCKANDCEQQEGTGNERRALVYALEHFEELGLTGGILHVGGNIAAFTFGMPINRTTFGVHVEKADTNIEGAYAMINYEFANHIPEQYIYLNREEDLGIEGLRKAKLSYQPAIILEKYSACLKEEPVEHIKW